MVDSVFISVKLLILGLHGKLLLKLEKMGISRETISNKELANWGNK